MSANLIADVEITDANLYGQFLERMTTTVENHGGKFVARSGQIEVMGGDWMPRRLAIIELGSLQQAHAFLNSPEYTALDDIRVRSSNINIVLVDGL